jgi:hypothetical protein
MAFFDQLAQLECVSLGMVWYGMVCVPVSAPLSDLQSKKGQQAGLGRPILMSEYRVYLIFNAEINNIFYHLQFFAF